VIAIGGVTAPRAGQLRAAGAYGVAVVSSVSDAADPGAAASELWQAVVGAR
jgi:thiamine-phosphate pyrophosphorylase